MEATTISARHLALPRAPLLSIAPELRNTIYRYALVSSEPIRVDFDQWRNRKRGRFTKPAWKRQFTMTAPLTMVSRQIRRESLGIFVGENTFYIDSGLFRGRPKRLHALQEWCQASPSHLESIQLHHRLHRNSVEVIFAAKRINQHIAITWMRYKGNARDQSVHSYCGHRINKMARGCDDMLDFLAKVGRYWLDVDEHSWAPASETSTDLWFKKMFRSCKRCRDKEWKRLDKEYEKNDGRWKQLFKG